MSDAQITWMNIGARYSTPERRPQVEAVIAALDWIAIANEGETLSLPLCPGEGIKATIRELRLPKVSAIAWNGAMTFRYSNRIDDVEYPALYGIEANYKNGRARVYVVDNGCEILPVRSDFWPNGGSDVPQGG